MEIIIAKQQKVESGDHDYACFSHQKTNSKPSIVNPSRFQILIQLGVMCVYKMH